jgi:hypothetical protein
VTTGPARALRRRLGQYLDGFSECFSRQPQRDAASQYLDGLLNDSERKSMQAMHGRLSAKFVRLLEYQMARNPRFLLTLLLLLATLAPGCLGGGVFSKERLVGRFAMWAVDGLSDNSVVEESEDGHASRVLIPPTVFAVGFNNQFIIAKRHPKRGAQVDRANTEFYVVSVLDGQVHGPVDSEKFLALRATLGVPASLDFSRVVQQLAASR